MTEPMHEPQQNDEPQQAEALSQPASQSRPAPQAPAPAPTPPAPAPAPTPPAPTPASANGDVPVENWRRDLEQIDQAPSAERHELLSALLDDLDSKVSSL